MNIILLSGGSGKRLWPLSNEVRSKQFLKLFKNSSSGHLEEGVRYESMLQRVYRQILSADPHAHITIATSKSQVSQIHNQIGFDVGISVEPCRRDTFPAIVLASAYLHDVKRISEEEAVVVCPVDPYVDDAYFRSILELQKLAQSGTANLALLGIQPTYPSEKYGYILPESSDMVSKVTAFTEKPNRTTAAEYIQQGGLWNGGIFAFKLSYLLRRAHEIIDFTCYDDLLSKYDTLKKISFDYAIAEHEPNIVVMRYHGSWKDLGTWNTLTEAMQDSSVGHVHIDNTCSNVHIINELNIPILAMGLHDTIISASPDGILVSDKMQSSYIKSHVDKISQQIMYAEKSWGSFRILDIGHDSLTIKVTLNSGHSMNYHSHDYRDEKWIVISGKGSIVLDGTVQPVSSGDVISLPAQCKHTAIAETELVLIEVQHGKEISVHDKHKHTLPIRE